MCFVGGIPIITKFSARQYSNEIRLEAAAFVRQMYQTSTLTLQMFVSAGGLNVLVEFLDEDYDEARDLVLIGVNGIWNVFELQVHSYFQLAISCYISNIRRDLPPRTTSVVYSQGARFCHHWPLCWIVYSMRKKTNSQNSLKDVLSTYFTYFRKQRIMSKK